MANWGRGIQVTPYLQVMMASCDLLLKFWDTLHISGMVGASWCINAKCQYPWRSI